MASGSRPKKRAHAGSFSSGDSQSFGLSFATQDQLDRFTRICHWPLAPTRFPDTHTLQLIKVHNAVNQLFSHIGWGPLLQWHEYSYAAPTLEFLSTASISADGATLRFRTKCQNCEVSMYNINELGSNSDRAYTYAPEVVGNLDDETLRFWNTISDDDGPFTSRSAKASLILHPALKIAHRLLSQLIFSREDAGSISQLELHLLYAMTHGDPNDPTRPKPDFARWVLYKPLSISTGRKCRIMCGGIISRILSSGHVRSALRLQEDDHPPIPGETSLTIPALHRTGMFNSESNEAGRQTHLVWIRMLSNTRYLRVPLPTNAPGADLLNLTPDIRDQNWALPSNTDGPIPAREEVYHPGRRPDPPAPEGPPQDYPPYHNQYMDEFGHIRGQIQGLDTRYTTLQTSFEAEQALSLQRWQDQQTYQEEMLRMQRQMYGMHFPPPPPPPDYQ